MRSNNQKHLMFLKYLFQISPSYIMRRLQ